MPMKEPRFARIIRRFLLTIGLLMLALLAATHWLFNTGHGARFVLAYALPKVQALLPAHLQIHMRGVNAESLSDMRIRILTVNDEHGPWLYVKNFTFRWNPLALWEGGMEIETLKADKLQFLRIPDTGETEPAALKDSIQNAIQSVTALPKQLDSLSLPPVILTELNIASLEISEAILPQPSFYTLSGKANLKQKPEFLALRLDNVEGIPSHARFHFENTDGAPQFELVWQEDANGLLSHFLPLKTKDARLSVQSSQATKEDVLHFSLTATQGENDLLELELRVKEQERIELYAQLPTPAAFEGVEEGTAPLLAQSSITREHIHLSLNNTLLQLGDAVYKDSLADMNIHIRDKKHPYLVETTLRSTLPSGEVASAFLRSEGDGDIWEINGLNASLGADATLALAGNISLNNGTANLQGNVAAQDTAVDMTVQASDIFENWGVKAKANITALPVTLPEPLSPLLTLPLTVSAEGSKNSSITLAMAGAHLKGTGEIFPDATDNTLLAKVDIASQNMETAYHITAEHNASQHGSLLFRFDEGQVSANYHIGEELATLSGLTITGGDEIHLRGGLSYHLAQGTMNGEITGFLRGFSTLMPLGVPDIPLTMLTGDVRVRLAPVKQEQNIRLSYQTGRTALNNEVLMDDFSVDASVILPKNKEPVITLRGDVQNLQQFLPLETARLEANGTPSAIAFGLTGEHSITPTELKSRGAFADGVLTLSTLALQHRKHDYRITKPLKLAVGEDAIALSNLHFIIDNTGTIRGDANLTADTVKGTITILDIPLNAIPVSGLGSLHGNLDGNVALSGKAASPVLDVTLTVEDLQQNYPSLTRIHKQPLSGTLKARIANGHLKSSFDAAVPRANSSMKTNFAMPFGLSLIPSDISVTPGERFDASVNADIILAPFLPLFLPDGIYGAGHVTANLKASGAFDSPSIIGDMSLRSGHFELLQTVSSIRNLSFDARANGKEIRITDGSATDGGSGSISFSGKVGLTPVMPMDVGAQVNQFVVMRHPSATATVSGATTLKGNLQDALLKGEWEIETARIAINPVQSSDIPEIRIVEVASLNDPLETPPAQLSEEERKRRQAEQQAERPFAENLNLNVGVEAKNQIFLEGFGLNAELRGRVDIKGTAADPKVGGTMETIRGRWEFFGKLFTIVRGQASLSENNLTAPMIDIEAQANANDVLAVATIKGTTDQPEIRFSSIPSLPQDEILSRVMFGQNLNNISPFQAIQLADMIRTLKGGNTINPLTQLQHKIGIDQLRINNNEAADDVTVGVGKYLSDGIYLEVEGGAGENSGKISVEVDLTPRISVETQTRQNADTAIRFNYKFDY